MCAPRVDMSVHLSGPMFKVYSAEDDVNRAVSQFEL